MKRILYEAPVDDFMSQEAKEKILGAQNRKYQKAKEEASGSNLGELMNYLPNIESQHYGKLLNLLKHYFFLDFRKLKKELIMVLLL